MARYELKPNTILIDNNGRPTRDLFLFLQYLNSVSNDLASLVVAQTIVNGDTTHAPSGNAVFDSLALKANTADLVSTLLIDSIADSDITHAPTRNAVFDALALKQGLDAQLTALAGITPVAGDFTLWTALTTAVSQAIVGTVSQSGGVPTGSLVEYGTNANGSYLRLPANAQFCWQTMTVQATTWTFPAAFSANPTMAALANATSGASAPRIMGYTSVGTTSGVFERNRFDTGATVSGTAMLIAIGNWF